MANWYSSKAFQKVPKPTAGTEYFFKTSGMHKYGKWQVYPI